MAKKRIVRIPKSYTLKCPQCQKNSRALASIENSPQGYQCPKCNKEIKTPITSCCVICAYDHKQRKCPRNYYMEARIKGLEMK